jgi:hypothetical protein
MSTMKIQLSTLHMRGCHCADMFDFIRFEISTAVTMKNAGY